MAAQQGDPMHMRHKESVDDQEPFNYCVPVESEKVVKTYSNNSSLGIQNI